MKKLLLATTNKGKIGEYRYLFRDLSFEIVSPMQENMDIDVDEKYITLEENARQKALEYAERIGIITVADDSGLEVDALGGEPGVRSSRYAGEGASDEDRVNYLLSKMEGVPPEKRTARFRCVIAIADKNGIKAVCNGECNGTIALEPKGENGFGYDPVFFLPGLNKTLAELDTETKNALSHRASAAREAGPILSRLAEEIVQ
ncbi:MAG: RdgB/HAM1 family non-canonical purine NTP pyrophosphatase [Dehalococcoidia bacterium]